MPEAPEVQYLVNNISKYCKNKSLLSVSFIKGRYIKHGKPANFIKFQNNFPLKLIKITKIGKVIIFHFQNEWYLVSRLGLTGWWYVNKNKSKWLNGNPNVIFKFNDTILYYHDTLSYGTLKFIKGKEILDKEVKNLAPQIESISLKELLNRLNKKPLLSKKYIEDVILDQTALFCGIGNYLKSEILYVSRISPKRKIGSLSINDWKIFLKSAKYVIKRIVKSIGNEDKYMNTMYIYKKKIDKYGNNIEKYKANNGRMTYWVPSLQL